MRNIIKHPLLYVMLAASVLATSCYSVDEGEYAVRTIFGKTADNADDAVKDAGLHGTWIIGRNTHRFNMRLQKTVGEISSFTADGQESTINITLTYYHKKDKKEVLNTYKTFGKDYADKIINPNILQIIKDENAKWEAMELISNRDKITSNIEKKLIALFKQKNYPIQIESFRIENIDFQKDFKASIEQKVIAYQNFLKEQNNTMAVAEQNKQTISKAEAEAKALKLKSDAAKQNEKYTELKILEKWDGKLPQVYSGGKGNIFSVVKDLKDFER